MKLNAAWQSSSNRLLWHYTHHYTIHWNLLALSPGRWSTVCESVATSKYFSFLLHYSQSPTTTSTSTGIRVLRNSSTVNRMKRTNWNMIGKWCDFNGISPPLSTFFHFINTELLINYSTFYDNHCPSAAPTFPRPITTHSLLTIFRTP